MKLGEIVSLDELKSIESAAWEKAKTSEAVFLQAKHDFDIADARYCDLQNDLRRLADLSKEALEEARAASIRVIKESAAQKDGANKP